MSLRIPRNRSELSQDETCLFHVQNTASADSMASRLVFWLSYSSFSLVITLLGETIYFSSPFTIFARNFDPQTRAQSIFFFAPSDTRDMPRMTLALVRKCETRHQETTRRVFEVTLHPPPPPPSPPLPAVRRPQRALLDPVRICHHGSVTPRLPLGKRPRYRPSVCNGAGSVRHSRSARRGRGPCCRRRRGRWGRRGKRSRWRI